MGIIGSETLPNWDAKMGWHGQSDAVNDISTTLNVALADMFMLYVKTKNFHWHISGPHFRDYHLLFDEQADQIFAATDAVAERVRKIGGTTLRSVTHIARRARLRDNDADHVAPIGMVRELHADNERLAEKLREAHLICADYEDVASTRLLETLIDESEKRSWFLLELMRLPEGAS